MKTRLLIITLIVPLTCMPVKGQSHNTGNSKSQGWEKIDTLCGEVADRVKLWYRDLHQNPELGNREFRTAKIIAEHLEDLGIEVISGVAHTGVVGILKCNGEGPVIALRADIDALPVRELTSLPYASKATAMYNGQEVPVMHACGHDAHTAILMGVAEVLSKCRDKIPGTVKFIFQPAEDSKPGNENGGAELMISEGVLKNPDVDAIFGMHVVPYPSGTLRYRSAGLFAAVDNFTIVVKGKQAHGALPWTGVDAITVASQIVTAIQTIISRQTDLTESPAVITIGTINGGIQQNILCSEVTMKGTIRTFSPDAQKMIHERIRITAEQIAQSSGALAETQIYKGVPAVMNDPGLTEALSGTLIRTGSETGVSMATPLTVGDDFALYAMEVPGFYFLLGILPEGTDPYRSINHSPYFTVDEKALVKGVEALCHLVTEYGNKSNEPESF